LTGATIDLKVGGDGSEPAAGFSLGQVEDEFERRKHCVEAAGLYYHDRIGLAFGAKPQSPLKPQDVKWAVGKKA